MPSEALDAIDWRILAQLQEDARGNIKSSFALKQVKYKTVLPLPEPKRERARAVRRSRK